jgi:beta-carotene 3-hydroxylase
MLRTFLFIVFGFLLMEAFSYVVHRYLFHGLLWKVHSTHHKPLKGLWETNDFFSLIFVVFSLLLIFSSNSVLFSIGFGIAAYGIAYFAIHDAFIHRRFFPFKSKNKILLTIRAAHQRHHQSTTKEGLEPFGLFIFNYKKFLKKSHY